MIEYKNSEIIIQREFSNPQLEIIESLSNEEMLQFQNGTVFIPIQNFYQLDEFSQRWLGIPELYSGEVRIRLEGAGLLDDQSKMIADYFDKQNNLYDFKRLGPFLFENSIAKYTLPSIVLDALLLVEQYNQIKSKKDNNSGYQVFAKLKKACDGDIVILDSLLKNQDIIFPESVKLKVEVNGDEVMITPALEDLEDFDLMFLEKSSVKEEYRGRNAEGGRTRVIIDGSKENGKLKSELEKLKAKPSYKGNEVKELIENAGDIFNSDLVDISELFGDRVLGMQVFIPPSIPVINKIYSEWIPGFQISEKLILVNDQYDYLLLKNSHEISKETGLSSVYFKGYNFDISSVESVLKLSKRLYEDREQIDESLLEHEYKEILVIKTNIEELEAVSQLNEFSVDDVKIRKAKNFNSEFQLKEHQVQGVAWLQTCHFDRKIPGALLADDMGLGKTLQILYFLETVVQIDDKKNTPSLIVCPSSLLENWIQEYNRFFHNHSHEIMVITGTSTPQLNEIRNGSYKKPPLCFVTYETMRMNAAAFCTINWGIVILDEAQKIKNPKTQVTFTAKGLKSEFKIALTGTPVENSLLDLWCIVDFCVPGRLGSVKQFSKRISSKEIESEAIRKLINPFFLRRLKSDVAKDLPKKQDHYIHKEFSGKQLDLYQNVLNQLSLLKQNNLLKGTAMLQAIHQLKSITDHVELVNSDHELNLDELEDAAKLSITLEIIEAIRLRGEKLIVFTEKRKMQFILKRVFRDRYGLNVDIINGDVPSTTAFDRAIITRQALIDKFHDVHGFNIIIMSPIEAGFGLNVIGANHVIHYSRHWNPAKEQQATDRVYRIGQTKDVHIYYPIAILPNKVPSFDEVLDKRLREKKTLSNDIMFPSEKIEVSNQEILNDLFNHT